MDGGETKPSLGNPILCFERNGSQSSSTDAFGTVALCTTRRRRRQLNSGRKRSREIALGIEKQTGFCASEAGELCGCGSTNWESRLLLGEQLQRSRRNCSQGGSSAVVGLSEKGSWKGKLSVAGERAQFRGRCFFDTTDARRKCSKIGTRSTSKAQAILMIVSSVGLRMPRST